MFQTAFGAITARHVNLPQNAMYPFMSVAQCASPRRYFWDFVHVYDEVNLVIAERTYAEIRPVVEGCFARGS